MSGLLTLIPAALTLRVYLYFTSIEEQLNDMVGQYQKLDHHVEHALASVQDHIANMISKLEKREDKSEGRIEDLESVREGRDEMAFE